MIQEEIACLRMVRAGQLLTQLDETVAGLIETYQSLDCPDKALADGWTAKEVLSHITFWHESFARNVSALAAQRQPLPLRGKYVALNQRSVEEMKGLTIEQILAKLQSAHQIIQQTILSPTLTLIPYRQGSRPYTPEEHLVLVRGHITEHLKNIDKARNTGAG